ncbi:START-like domain-containing protein [Sunxiuqinia sp. A32]|uniref:START-like domain-containing protein n=1 Tax=Sunxiuqinia sp. A32 TaxID=3461496 RepID=UPI00404641B8
MALKSKIQLEFPINCSPKVLYNRLSTASGLAEWFADDVKVKGKNFIFVWEGSEQHAEKTLHKESKLVRFTWLDDEEEGTYFEFRINKDELTGDVSLIVIDFSDEDEEEETTDLWNSQISDLKHILGC